MKKSSRKKRAAKASVEPAAPASAKESPSSPRLEIHSLRQLPSLFALIEWHLGGDPEKTRRFLSAPTSFLRALGIHVSPALSRRFEKRVVPNLRFLDAVVDKKRRTGSATTAKLTLAPKKDWEKLFAQRPGAPQFKPPVPRAGHLKPRLGTGPGNFAVILQLSESFFQSFYHFAMRNYGFAYLPSSLQQAYGGATEYQGWFLLYFKVTLDLLDPGEAGFSVSVSQTTQDALTIAGTVNAQVAGSGDGQTWSGYSPVGRATFGIEAPLSNLAAFDLAPTVQIANLPDVALTNVIGGSTAGGATVSGLDGMDLLAVTYGVTQYFQQNFPVVPVMAELPSLPAAVSSLGSLSAFGLTIPSGGVQPIISMQFGNPNTPYRQPLLLAGEDLAAGISNWIASALIGQSLPSFPFQPSDGVTVKNGFIECVDDSVQLTVTGTLQTCSCWFDADFTLTLGLAFGRNIDGNLIPVVNRSDLSSSDLTIWESVFIGAAAVFGIIAAGIVQGIVIPSIEKQVRETVTNQLQALGFIPRVIVVQLVPGTTLPMYLRIGPTGVVINPSGVFLHASLAVRSTDPVIITAFTDVFTGLTRMVEVDDAHPTVSRFLVDLDGNGVFLHPLEDPNGQLFSWTAFNSVEIKANPLMPDKTSVKVTLVANRLMAGATAVLGPMPFAPDPANPGLFLPVQLGAFRASSAVGQNADQMIIEYV